MSNASKTICDNWLKWIVKEMPELELYDLRHFWARRNIRQNVLLDYSKNNGNQLQNI